MKWKNKFNYLISTILWLFVGCYSPPSEEECKEIFMENLSSFEKFRAISNKTIDSFPQCSKFRLTYTQKSYWQECVKRLNNSAIPKTFITGEDQEFMFDFMYKCKLHIIEFDSTGANYYFFGADPFEIKYSKDSISAYSEYKIGKFYYLLPPK